MSVKNLLWATCLFFVFQSCQKAKDVNDLNGDQLNKTYLIDFTSTISGINVYVKDGALHFNDAKTFFKDIDVITKMSEDEFVAFEKELGFKSLSTVLEEAYESFDKIGSEYNFKEWEAKYGDIVGLKDSVVTPLIPILTYQRIVNRSGEYYLGDSYVKVVDGKLVTILDGDKAKLKGALKTKDSGVESGIFVDNLVKSINEPTANSKFVTLSSAAPCGTGYLSAMKEVSKRKVWVDYYVVIYRALSEYAGVIQVTGSAHKKTWIGWNKYKTRYRIEDVNFSIVNGKGQTISA